MSVHLNAARVTQDIHMCVIYKCAGSPLCHLPKNGCCITYKPCIC